MDNDTKKFFPGMAFIGFLFILVSCNESKTAEDLTAEAMQEITAAETQFEKSVADKGIKTAFLEFADDSAAINRGNKMYMGKMGIAEYYDKQTLKNISLTWKPDYVQASASGDLGYTYGKFKFMAEDSLGKKIESEGIFHSVWKKQKDGFWKFVYD